MNDIAPDLLKKLKKYFAEKYNNDPEIKRILNLENLSYADANNFAIRVGEILANTYQELLTPVTLPDGRMYWNIAERIIEPTMKHNFDIISKFTSRVQSYLNKEAGLGLKAIKPQLNEDRIKGILERLAAEELYADIKWILNEPIVNFSQSIVDDSIKANAEFHARAGLKPKVVRVLDGTGCEWCRSLAGEYSYPNVPSDVYRRHEKCRCTIEYKTGDGRIQNVHSRKWI